MSILYLRPFYHIDMRQISSGPGAAIALSGTCVAGFVVGLKDVVSVGDASIPFVSCSLLEVADSECWTAESDALTVGGPFHKCSLQIRNFPYIGIDFGSGFCDLCAGAIGAYTGGYHGS